MSTIKSPQPISQSKNHSSQGGNGFVVFLLILTWIAIGGVFYGVKSGMIKSEEGSSPVNEKITSLESNVSALDARLKALEKRLADASSALSPILQGQPQTQAQPENAMKPEVKPEELMQMAPVKPEAGADVMAPALNQPIQPPKVDEKAKPEDKTGAAPVKPQTDNSEKSGSDKASSLEKKGSI